MLKTLNKYLYIMYTSYKNYTVYSYDILWKILTFGFRICVIILLYKVIFETYWTQSGFNFAQATWAVIFSQIFATSNISITNMIDSDIKSWKIWIQLLNPFSYTVFKFLELSPKILFYFSLLSVVGLLIGYFFLWWFWFSLLGILWGIIVFIGSFLINFLWYMIIWLLGFYTEDTEAFRWIYHKMIMVFGWNLLPVNFLPSILQSFAFFSPFIYTWYSMWITFVDFQLYNFLKSFGIMIFWIVLYLTIMNILYKNAIKRLNINWW